MGTTLMAERVRARLDALGINPFEAARRAGLQRGYINELLSGKKRSVRQLDKIAAVLECDPEYLRGAQPEPRRAPRYRAKNEPIEASMPLMGVCELNVWREPDAPLPAAYLPINPDPRFPPEHQAAYLVRDDHALEIGITDRMVVDVVDPATLPGGLQSLKSGDTVVVRRTSKTGSLEFSIRVLELRLGGAILRLPSATSSGDIPWPSTTSSQQVDIVGLVVRTILLFRADA